MISSFWGFGVLGAGKWLNVDAVIFNDDDYQLLEEGGKYLFLNPSDPTTYNTIR